MGSVYEMKNKNLLEIVQVIWKKEYFTKPNVTDMTDLTSVTVHKMINEMMANKLVVEQGEAKSNGGRKATLYKINEKFGYIVGILFGIDFIRTSVFDLKLTMLHSRCVKSNMAYSHSIIELFVSEIDAALADVQLSKQDCLAVGLSLPGQVDHERGVVVNLPNVPNWRGVALKTILEERLKMTVLLDNDNNGSVLACKWLGMLGNTADAVFISITDGVGAGVLTKGRIVYGKHFNVGEIGHITIKYDGIPCNCGGHGCIETLTSYPAIMKKIKSAIHETEDYDKGKTMADYVKQALDGDKTIYGIFQETGAFISIALDLVVKAYDPEMIILQNNWLKNFPEIYLKNVNEVYSRCAWLQYGGLKIILNAEENIDWIGPAALVQEYLLTSIDNNPLFDRLSVLI